MVASLRAAGLGLLLALASACQTEYDEPGFRRAIERAYGDAHPGWAVLEKKEGSTFFHRGDQVDELEVDALFRAYKSSGKSGSAFIEAWLEKAKAEEASRHRTLAEAKDEVIPIIKSEKWIQYQDLGAIGPRRKLPEIRPWRKPIAGGVYIVLGVPEDKLGYRFASIAEVEASPDDADAWVERAIENLARQVRAEAVDETGAYQGVEVDIQGRLKAFDLANVDGISAMVLDRDFREAMLEKFALDELGAAVPIRKVLIVFDPNDFVALKPARNRAKRLYDTQNHPGFRGLLRFDADEVDVLETGEPPER